MALSTGAGRSCRPISLSPSLFAPRRVCQLKYLRRAPEATRQITSSTRERPRASRSRQSTYPCVAADGILRSIRVTESHRQTASFWSWRALSSWHRPGCKWVRSEGDPRQTPRDKDCPACQEEASRPTELSHRELIWQRQMQFMKEFLERDPYDALFGRSNDRLRGILPKAFWHESLHSPWSSRTWTMLPRSASFELDTRIEDPSITASRPRRTDKCGRKESSKEEPARPASGASNPDDPPASRHDSPPSVHGYGRWTVSATDSRGKTVEESGEMVYDPITMRMVPVPAEPKSTSSSGEGKGTPPIETSVEKSQSTPIRPMESSSSKNNSQTTGDEKTQPASGPNDTKQTKTSLGVTISDHRLALIRKVEKEMSLAHARLNQLVDVYMHPLGLSTTAMKAEKANAHSEEPPRRMVASRDKANRHEALVGNSKAKLEIRPGKKETATSIPVKEALEKSWLKENGFVQSGRISKTQPPESKNGEKGPQTSLAKSLCNDSQAHFRQTPPKPADRTSLASYRMLNKRDRSLKHMTSTELGRHRAALIESWEKKQRAAQKNMTDAEQKLAEEISAQKAAMARLENRLGGRKEVAGSKPISSGDKKSTQDPSESAPAATGEGDVCPNAVTFASSERWYKKKAPHAFMNEQQKLQDRALVSTIREIYERSYGVIDENHRQGKPTEDPQTLRLNKLKDMAARVEQDSENLKQFRAAQPRIPQEPFEKKKQAEESARSDDRSMYKILAYDPSTRSIHFAVASSTFSPPTGDTILSVPNALPRLHHPAKFLPYISKLEADGYQVASASKNILVLKRVRPSITTESSELGVENDQANTQARKTSANTKQSILVKPVNPVDGTADFRQPYPPATSTGNFASPTGFVNHDILEVPPSPAANSKSRPSSTPSPENPRVRKEEAVFTGRPIWSSNQEDYPMHTDPVSSGGGGSHSQNGKKNSGRAKKWAKFVVVYSIVGSLAVCSIYMLGSFVEESVETSAALKKAELQLQALAVEDRRSSAPTSTSETDNATPATKQPSRFGYWAVVEREHAHRAEVAELKAEVRKMREAQTVQQAREEEMKRKLGAALSAGIDVAIFGTLLWAFTRFLESSGR